MLHEIKLSDIKQPYGSIKALYLLSHNEGSQLLEPVEPEKFRILIDTVEEEPKEETVTEEQPSEELAEPVADEKAWPPKVDEAPVEPEEEKPKKAAKRATQKKPVDAGKVIALRNAGWSYKEIGEEMGISLEGARQVYLRAMDLKEKKE